MGTVTIGTDEFSVYGTSAGLATHANGSSAYYAAYTAAVAASADGVKRVHVEATRLIMLLSFEDDDNADPATAEADVATACYELVLAAIVDPSILTQASTAKNIRRVGAGDGVEVEFFGPTAGSRFPARVMALLGPLLESTTASAASSYAANTSACSNFDDGSETDDRYGLTRG